MGFPVGSDGKESACNARDLGLIPQLGRSPGGGHGNPLQYSCLENPHRQRNLVSNSPWGLRESDTTERLRTYIKKKKKKKMAYNLLLKVPFQGNLKELYVNIEKKS